MSSLLKISVSILYLFLLHLTVSGSDPYFFSAGASEAGTGYVCTTKNGFWSSFHNQALLANNPSFSIGINYQDRFGLKELGTRSIGLKIPAGKTSIGAVYSHFGYSDFYRQMTGLATGIKLSDKIAAGVQVDYFSERTSGEYNNNQSVTCETSLLITAFDNIRIGINLFNPIPNSIRQTFLPSRLRIGAGTDLSKVLFAGIEAEMSSGSNLIIRTGFEYEAVKNLWIRGAFISENTSFCCGVGFLAKIARIDLGFETHERLGITSSISLIFKIH